MRLSDRGISAAQVRKFRSALVTVSGGIAKELGNGVLAQSCSADQSVASHLVGIDSWENWLTSTRRLYHSVAQIPVGISREVGVENSASP
jgi:hypothetical protein